VVAQARQVVKSLTDRHVTNAAVIVVSNATDEILAYVGSVSYADLVHRGRVDGVQALRQPGSTLKPFLYQLALERGYTPATVLPDSPSVYPLVPGSPYRPTNYDDRFHGPVRLRSALANSYNVPACYVTAEIGVSSLLQRLKDLGFTSLRKDAEYYGVGLVLGNGEVTLYQLARAYAALARGGRWRPLRCYVQHDGDISPPAAEERRISDPESTFLVTDILSDPYERAPSFGSRSILRLPFPCAVKTGTSSHFRDNWTVGYTPDYTVAVWVGDFDATPLDDVSGVAGAGPLFARIMLYLYRDAPSPRFERPADLVRRPVCSVSGKPPGPYCPHCIEDWFRPRDLVDYQRDRCTWHRRVAIDADLGSAQRPQRRVELVVPARYRIPEVE